MSDWNSITPETEAETIVEKVKQRLLAQRSAIEAADGREEYITAVKPIAKELVDSTVAAIIRLALRRAVQGMPPGIREEPNEDVPRAPNPDGRRRDG
jgi:hypothetical protein